MHFRAIEPFFRALDPRRSLGTKVGWFVAALSLVFALVAAVWLGAMTRDGLREQHGRQLALDAGQLANTLDHALRARLHTVQTIAAIIGADANFHAPRIVRLVLDELRATYPELDWIGFFDARGNGVAATRGSAEETGAAGRAWFRAAATSPWIGEINAALAPGDASPAAPGAQDRLIGIAAPVRDSAGRFLGVVTAHLDKDWLAAFVAQLPGSLHQQAPPEILLLGRDRTVLAGPPEFVGRRWAPERLDRITAFEETASPDPSQGPPQPAVERLVDGRLVLVSDPASSQGETLRALGWTVLLVEPATLAGQRAQGLWNKIIRASLAIGGMAALFGILISRRLTRRVAQLARSVDAAGSTGSTQISVPSGHDEISRLGHAFSALLDALAKERGELSALGADLERRVIARTREVERLARESRYSAVVRERLKIARDLHDTLAHSMMAMLAQVRVLRKLYERDPAALAQELVHAEKVAHDGLIEARASIAQMRFNPVRDIGLGAALADALGKLAERTGLHVEADFDPLASAFAEESAEGVFRIAEEAIHNIERHAGARNVRATLRCIAEHSFTLELADDGTGFDPAAPHPGHFGLVGMYEQAQLIGGRLAIESGAAGGTVLRLAFGPRCDG